MESPKKRSSRSRLETVWNWVNQHWLRFKIWYDLHFKHLWIEFCNNTNIHGFQQTVNPDHINLKIGLLIFLFLIIVWTIVAAGKVASEYRKGIIQTSITHRPPATFPPILFCPPNWIDQPKAAQVLGESYWELLEFIVFLPWKNYYLLWENEEVLKSLEKKNISALQKSYWEAMDRNNLTTVYELYMAISVDLNIFSQMQGVKNITKFMRANAVCYRVIFEDEDSDDNMFLVRSLVYDLTLNGDIQPPDGSILVLPYHALSIGDDAYSPLSQNALPITRGVSFDVAIQASHHVHFSTTESPCNTTLMHASQEHCIARCQRKYVEELFNCTFFFGQRHEEPNSTYCLLMPGLKNITEISPNSPEAGKLELKRHDCDDTCFLPCDTWVYDPLILETGDWSIDEDRAQLSFRYMNYFSSLQYEDSSTYAWCLAIANVGGMVSLWSGASFIALAHVAYHFGLRQICPKPKTVTRMRSRLSSSAVNLAIASHENVTRIKKKVPLWKKPVVAAALGAQKVSTAVVPRVQFAKDRIHKISSATGPKFDSAKEQFGKFGLSMRQSVPTIFVEETQSVGSSKVPSIQDGLADNCSEILRPYSPARIRIPFVRPRSKKEKKQPVIPSYLRIPSLEEADQTMRNLHMNTSDDTDENSVTVDVYTLPKPSSTSLAIINEEERGQDHSPDKATPLDKEELTSPKTSVENRNMPLPQTEIEAYSGDKGWAQYRSADGTLLPDLLQDPTVVDPRSNDSTTDIKDSGDCTVNEACTVSKLTHTCSLDPQDPETFEVEESSVAAENPNDIVSKSHPDSVSIHSVEQNSGILSSIVGLHAGVAFENTEAEDSTRDSVLEVNSCYDDGRDETPRGVVYVIEE